MGAVSLARPVDHESLPALVETTDRIVDGWTALERVVRTRRADEIVERARLLGIPASVLGETAAAAPRSRRLWPRSTQPIARDLLVVDLSAMWAGPLCGRVLADLGASVVKVESPVRPDGARRGSPGFFDWMNAGKLHYAADPGAGDARLERLLDAADVVIEASRPRALLQGGLDAESRAPRSGRVWVRITGYGPDHPMRVAFGDDAAVSGGLVGRSSTGPIFCGDAIADPLTGITAAHEVTESLRRGGGEVIDVAMADVAATYAALPPLPEHPLTERPHAVELREPTPPKTYPSAPTVDAMWLEQVVATRLGAPC